MKARRAFDADEDGDQLVNVEVVLAQVEVLQVLLVVDYLQHKFNHGVALAEPLWVGA